MNYDEKEKKLFSLMEAKRPEAFWAAQAACIKAGAAGRPFRAWVLAPVLGAAAVLVLLLARPGVRQPPPEAAVSTAFLEHLDMLDDMDVLEAVPEEEL